MAFFIDLPNRIENLPLSRSRPLVPLFEALTNSIQSIKGAKTKSGKIDIPIVRKLATALIDDVAPREPITGFEIVDNGIGFVEANFVWFCTSDSP